MLLFFPSLCADGSLCDVPRCCCVPALRCAYVLVVECFGSLRIGTSPCNVRMFHSICLRIVAVPATYRGVVAFQHLAACTLGSESASACCLPALLCVTCTRLIPSVCAYCHFYHVPRCRCVPAPRCVHVVAMRCFGLLRSSTSLCDVRMSPSICLRILQSLQRTAALLCSSTSLRVRRCCKMLRLVVFQPFSV